MGTREAENHCDFRRLWICFEEEIFLFETFIFCDSSFKKKFFVQNLELFKKDTLEIQWPSRSPQLCSFFRHFALLLNSHFPSSCSQGPEFVPGGPFSCPGINPDRSSPLLVGVGVLFSFSGVLYRVGCDSFGASNW